MTDPAAGWYADPHVQDQQRWWNGRQWTAETRRTRLGRLTGPLASTLPVYVAAAVGFLLATAVLLVVDPLAPRELARAEGPTLLLPATSHSRATVYGEAPGAQEPLYRCSLDPEGPTFLGHLVLSDRRDGNRVLPGLVELSRGWAGGARLTCPGATVLVAVTGSRVEQVLLPSATTVVGLGAGVFALAGLRARRRLQPDLG